MLTFEKDLDTICPMCWAFHNTYNEKKEEEEEVEEASEEEQEIDR